MTRAVEYDNDQRTEVWGLFVDVVVVVFLNTDLLG